MMISDDAITFHRRIGSLEAIAQNSVQKLKIEND